MDFFASHRMTNDRLYRIWEDGDVVMLAASMDILASKYPAKEAEFYRQVEELGLR